jgi:riboflavin kinase
MTLPAAPGATCPGKCVVVPALAGRPIFLGRDSPFETTHLDGTLQPYGMRNRMARLRGKVVSGAADFGRWIERLTSLYEQKTGMRLYPGTLNVQLPSEYSLPPGVIRLEAAEYGGRVSVNIVPCRIFDRRAFLLRTDQNEKGTGRHPRNIIEIAADVRLRDLYQLEDGDWVEIELP